MEPKKNIISGSEKSPAVSPAVREVSDTSLALDETVSHKVSEVVGELPPEDAGSTGQSQQAQPITMTAQERKAKLLASLPKEVLMAEVKMRKEITHVVEKKLNTLQKSVGKSKNDPYKLTMIMREIHHLRDVLASIVGAAFDYLQALWLRLVHGLNV